MGKVRPIGRRNKLERFLEKHSSLKEDLELIAGNFGKNELAYTKIKRLIIDFCDEVGKLNMVSPVLRYYQRISGYKIRRCA